MARALFTAAVTVLVAVGASNPHPSAEATVVIPKTIEQMAGEATAVIRARVQAASSAWDDGHRRIHTFTEFEVLETWLGTVPSSVVVRTLGGEVGRLGMKVSGVPRFPRGAEVVLFLVDDPLDPSRFQVVGLSQGFFQVERGAGPAVAVPGSGGLAYAVRGPSGSLKVDPRATGPKALTLDALRSRIARAARGVRLQSVPSAPPPLIPADRPRTTPTTVD